MFDSPAMYKSPTDDHKYFRYIPDCTKLATFSSICLSFKPTQKVSVQLFKLRVGLPTAK